MIDIGKMTYHSLVGVLAEDALRQAGVEVMAA